MSREMYTVQFKRFFDLFKYNYNFDTITINNCAELNIRYTIYLLLGYNRIKIVWNSLLMTNCPGTLILNYKNPSGILGNALCSRALRIWKLYNEYNVATIKRQLIGR